MATSSRQPTGVTRRQALRALGASSVVLGTGAVGLRAHDTLPGPVAVEAWRQWRTAPGLAGAVAAAVLAASPHNTQPWSFALTDRAVDVFVEPARNTGTVDPFRRELQMGLGCALENLLLGCEARGLAPRLRLLPDGPTGTRVATVSVQPGQPRQSRLYDAIGDRHTNRGPYSLRAVPAAALRDLAELSDLHELQLTWITAPAERAELGRLLVDAATALVRDRRQSEDNFAWFRSSPGAIRRHRDGLTLDGQGFSPFLLTLAKLLPASSREEGDRFWLKQTRDVHTATAAAYGVITTSRPNDRTTQLQAGQLLQRIHLAATSDGIALHHMNQITERIDRERSTGASATFASRFARLLPRGQTPLSTFRVGYAERAAIPSPRRTAREVIR